MSNKTRKEIIDLFKNAMTDDDLAKVKVEIVNFNKNKQYSEQITVEQDLRLEDENKAEKIGEMMKLLNRRAVDAFLGGRKRRKTRRKTRRGGRKRMYRVRAVKAWLKRTKRRRKKRKTKKKKKKRRRRTRR